MQKSVSSLTWPWRQEAAGSQPATPSALETYLPPVIGYAVAALFFFRLHRPLAAGIVASVTTVIFALAFLAPAAHARIQRGFARLGHVIGQALAWILLTPFFYLVMVPGRLVLFFKGRDLMQREFLPRMRAYWQDRLPGRPGISPRNIKSPPFFVVNFRTTLLEARG
ncbi:MAG: hypothetical protein U1F87_08790 [Kiritimatiellia bacterium]